MGIAAKHAYRFKFLKSEAWSNIRIQVLADKDAKCDICGFRDLSNDVHHIYYADRWEETPLEYLKVLCRGCHEEVHKTMETPEAKALMFYGILRKRRKELGLSDPEKPPAKELRNALDNQKKENNKLRAQLGLPNQKSEKKKRAEERARKKLLEDQDPKSWKKVKCVYCKSKPWQTIFSFTREFMHASKSGGNKWNVAVCNSCYCYLVMQSIESNHKAREARRLFDHIKTCKPPHKQLTLTVK